MLGVVNPFPPTLSCRAFNTVFDRGMDRLGSDVVDSPHDSSAPWVSLFHVCGVVYVWRSLHPSDRSFSWVRPNGSVASRVDFIGVPVHWLPPMNVCEICPCSYSAQCAVILSAIVPQALSRGPGIWKLKYLGFEGGRVCGFRDLFLVFCPIFDLAVVDWWEAAKSKIKGLPVTICKNCVACLRSQRDLPLSQVDNGSVSFVGPNLSANVELRKLDLEKL